MDNTSASDPNARSLALQDDERELLGSELRVLCEALPSQHREAYETLARVVAQGTVPADHLESLEKALEMMLATGHTRQAHRAEGERLLQALYARNPRGQALEQAQAQTNRALRALAGQRLDSVRVNATASGRHTITIATDDLQLTLVVGRTGVHVDKAAV